MKRRLWLPAFLAAAIALTAGICNRVPERQWDRGDFHTIPPNTKPYSLPTGLDVVHLYGAEDAIPTSDLPMDLALHNHTAGRIAVAFPAGLVFEPEVNGCQYMMVLQDFGFAVPAGGDTTVFVPTYCCNEDLDYPDETTNYQITVREYEKETNELLDLVSGKRLEGDTAVGLAQDALYEITDGNGLTDSTRAKLRALP